MSQPERITCPQCGASNFKSSPNCWQCGRSLADQQPEQTTPESPPGEESPLTAPPPPPVTPPSAEPPPSQDQKTMDSYIIWGFVLAGLGLFCCGCVTAIPAILLGAMAMSSGDRRGLWVIIAGAVSLILPLAMMPLMGGFPWQRHGMFPWRGPWPGRWP